MKIVSDINTFFREEQEKVMYYLKGKFSLSDSEAWDCYIEGCKAVWVNITNGKLTEDNLTCSLSTYLTRCCINHALKLIDKKKKRKEDLNDPFDIERRGGEGYVDDNDFGGGNIGEGEIDEEDITDINPDDDIDKLISILEKIILNLPEPCRTILWNVYYNYHEVQQECQEKETIMDVIALMLGMKKTVLKTTKNRCMNKVKDKVKTMLML